MPIKSAIACLILFPALLIYHLHAQSPLVKDGVTVNDTRKPVLDPVIYDEIGNLRRYADNRPPEVIKNSNRVNALMLEAMRCQAGADAIILNRITPKLTAEERDKVAHLLGYAQFHRKKAIALLDYDK